MIFFGLFLICLLLRLPSLRVPFLSDDEAAYAAMANILRHGGAFYRDAVDHKPPMTVWIYSAVFSLFGNYNMAAVHIVLILWVFATAYVLGEIAKHLGGSNTRWWAMLCYILYSTTLRDYDALAANNELLMNLPIALGVWACLKDRGFVAGLLLGLAVTVKYQAVFPALGLLGCLVWKRDIKNGGLFALGIILTGCATVGWIVWQGGWTDFYDWAVRFNLNYVDQGLGGLPGMERLLRRSLETILPAILVWGLGLSQCRRRPAILHFWLWPSLAAVLLGGRFFGHYFLQPLAPLSVLAGLLLPMVWSHSRGLRKIILLMLLVVPVAVFSTLAVRRVQLLRIVNEREPDYAGVGRRVQQWTGPNDRIFVWTNSPQIYHYARRVPGTRFTFCNYQSGQSPATPAEIDPRVDTTPYQVTRSWDLLMEDLEMKRPQLFVDAAHAHFDDFGKSPLEKFPRLARWVGSHYRLVEEFKGVRLYSWSGVTTGVGTPPRFP